MRVVRSTGSAGDCFENAMAESFFAPLECELIDQCAFRTQAEARMAIFEFIEAWYNTKRRHSALGYLSPDEFERAAARGATRRAGTTNHHDRTPSDSAPSGSTTWCWWLWKCAVIWRTALVN